MRIGILASGTGTILQALLDADLPIVAVIVDRPCAATERAEKAGVPVEPIERDDFGPDFDRLAYTHRVVDALERHEVDLVAMAGFGTILDKPFLDAFAGRIVNTHPALLPAFKGWHAVRRRARRGREGHGLHRALRDRSRSTTARSSPRKPCRSSTTTPRRRLHERIKDVERRLYPDVIVAARPRRRMQCEP